MKKGLVVLLVVAMLVSFAGCAQDSGREPIAPADGTDFNPDTDSEGTNYYDVRADLGDVPMLEGELTFGGVAKSFDNEYWRTLKQGMETGAEKFSAAGMDLTIDMASAQSEGDEEGQLAIVNDMINKEYDALLLSPISDANLVPGAEDALEAGIPVVNVNDGIISLAPNYVGPRAIENGELAAEWIANELNGEGQVAVIVGMPKAFAARQRTAGFKNYMEANAPGIEVVAEQNADWDRLKAKDLATTWITQYPDLKAIFCNNDTMALGAVEAVNEAGADILVVGVDGISEAYESIRNGGMDATVDSFPLYKGQIAVEMTIRTLAGQDVPRVVWTPQALIDASNVDMPAEEIIEWSDPSVG